MNKKARPHAVLKRFSGGRKLVGFLLAALLVLPASLSYPTQEAIAWDSYSGILQGVVVDPLHEDMTQMAYVRLIQDMQVSQNAGNLLDATTEAEYTERLDYLRQGAFWNDVPANSAYEFGQNYLVRERIPSFPGGYTSAYDIGAHLTAAVAAAKQESGWYLCDPRGMVRMSHNRRGNIIHSMLGVQADGKSYLTHQQQKDYSLQWLEVAYKYAQGKEDTLTTDQKKLLSFIDPYAQIKASPTKTGGDATRDISSTQGRLRALGMMCHTIEDSYNPAHTIRAYNEDKAGDILAFGVYEIQSIHKDYDHLNYATDSSLRTSFVSATTTLAGARSYPNPDVDVESLKTLSLKDSSNAAYTLLSAFYDGEDWDTVGPWLRDTVFASNFNGTGSYVFEGGRRAGDLYLLRDPAYDIAGSLRTLFPDQHTPINDTEIRYDALVEYQENLNTYYHDGAYDGSYHAAALDPVGQAAMQGAIDDYYTILTSKPADEVRALLEKMNPSDRAAFKSLVENTYGIIQEFSLDLTGATDAAYQAKTNHILSLLESNAGTATGSIEGLASNEFVLRLANGFGTILVAASPEICGMLQVGQQNVQVDYTISQPNGKFSYYDYTATAVTPATGDAFRHSKGVVADIAPDGTSITVTIDGSADYRFAVGADRPVPGDVVVGARIAIDYRYDAHSLQFYGARVISAPAQPLKPFTGVVEEYHGNIVLAQITDSTSGLPVFVAFDYGNADFIGNLAVGAAIEVLYYDKGEALYDLEAHDDTVINTFEASRIKAASHADEFIHVSNNNATHQRICTSLDANVQEVCTVGAGENCPLCGYAFERYTVAGTVTEEATGLGLSAVVQLKNALGENVGAAVTANADGTYVIGDVLPNTGYAVEARMPGYATKNSEPFDVLFADAAGVDVALNTPPVVLPYLSQGDGAVWYQGGSNGLLFVSTADFDAFTEVVVDGKQLAEGADFSKEAGSIRVTLSPRFLNGQAIGQHTISIGSTQGAASGSYSVAAPQPAPSPNPLTGDVLPLLGIALLGIAACIVAGVAYRRSRRKGA